MDMWEQKPQKDFGYFIFELRYGVSYKKYLEAKYDKTDSIFQFENEISKNRLVFLVPHFPGSIL